MVNLDKMEGQRGSLVLNEDGSIVSSTGELASQELVANSIMSLLSHRLPVNFGVAVTKNEVTEGLKIGTSAERNERNCSDWSRITVDFGTHSYLACVSNRKVNVVKRDNQTTSDEEFGGSDGVDTVEEES